MNKPFLLPCPFCGQPPKLEEHGVRNGYDDAWTFIRCDSCRVRPMASGSRAWRWFVREGWNDRPRVGRTKEEATLLATEAAIEAWNRRAPAQEVGK